MSEVINSTAQGVLRAGVERIERLEQEREDAAAGIREIYTELKGQGFDPAVVKDVVKARKQNAAQRAEKGAIFELYMDAVGA